MDSSADQSSGHMSHGLRGPHGRGRLTPEQSADVQRWLVETEADADLSVRELARFLSQYAPLEQAVRDTARSAIFGGLPPSSTTHAVAMLGMRATRQLVGTLAETSSDEPRPGTPRSR